MTIAQNDILTAQSARLQAVFGWTFGIGCFLLFSQVAYMPIKGLILSIGSPDAAAALENAGAFFLLSLPTMALLAALRAARNLFKSYAEGPILTVANGQKLGRMGDWLTASAALALLFGPASAKMDAVTGAYISTQIALLGVGLAFRLLGRIQAGAAEIAADHAQIV